MADDQVEIKDLTEGTPSDSDWLIFQLASSPFTVYKALKSTLKGEKGDKGDTGSTGATGATGATGPKGDTGDDGASAYVYIAYASDASGTGFTMTFNSSLDYIAIKETTSPIASPSAGDFAGLWKNYKGATGATGSTGAKGDKGDKGDTGDQGPQGDPGLGLGQETASGTINGSNTAFTVTNTPVMVLADGMMHPVSASTSDFNGNAVTFSGGTITFNALSAPTQYVVSYYNLS